MTNKLDELGICNTCYTKNTCNAMHELGHIQLDDIKQCPCRICSDKRNCNERCTEFNTHLTTVISNGIGIESVHKT